MDDQQVFLSIMLIFVVVAAVRIKPEHYDRRGRPLKSLSWKVDGTGALLAAMILLAIFAN